MLKAIFNNQARLREQIRQLEHYLESDLLRNNGKRETTRFIESCSEEDLVMLYSIIGMGRDFCTMAKLRPLGHVNRKEIVEEELLANSADYTEAGAKDFFKKREEYLLQFLNEGAYQIKCLLWEMRCNIA